MSVDNLPAVRTSTAMATVDAVRGRTPLVATVKPLTAAKPAPHRLSEDLFVVAGLGVVLTGSAAWGHLLPQALGIGVGTAALIAAGFATRRQERQR